MAFFVGGFHEGGSPKGGGAARREHSPSLADRKVLMEVDDRLNCLIGEMKLETRFTKQQASSIMEALANFIEHPQKKENTGLLMAEIEKIIGSRAMAADILGEFLEHIDRALGHMEGK